MTSWDIQQIIQGVIDNQINYDWVYIIISGVVWLIWAGLYSYFQSKWKNLATKEDIWIITKEIESVKAVFQSDLATENKKRDLKNKCIFKSLELIDCHFSQIFSENNNVSKQYATTGEARECHNELILSCGEEILSLFNHIMFTQPWKYKKLPTDLLNDFRNAARKELGFWEGLELNRENTWFWKVGFERNE